MPLARDLSDLPKGDKPEGEPPDRDADIMRRISEALKAKFMDDDDRPFSIDGVTVRGSWATKCARQIGYGILRLPKEERSFASTWAMTLGKMVHDMVEGIFLDAYPGAEVEVTVDLRPDVDGSGNIDAVIREDLTEGRFRPGNDPIVNCCGRDAADCDCPEERVTVFELKTTGGYGYKLMATNFRGPEEGPKWAAKVQGALYATAMNADRLVVGYISMEAISPDQGGRSKIDDLTRVMAQWSYTPEQFRPWAEREHRRLTRIAEFTKEAIDLAEGSDLYDRYVPAMLPPRSIDDPEVPVRARISDPMFEVGKGRWEVVDEEGRVTQVGTTWQCGYCDYRPICVADGPSR